jgi:hypothetical protein
MEFGYVCGMASLFILTDEQPCKSRRDGNMSLVEQLTMNPEFPVPIQIPERDREFFEL